MINSFCVSAIEEMLPVIFGVFFLQNKKSCEPFYFILLIKCFESIRYTNKLCFCTIVADCLEAMGSICIYEERREAREEVVFLKLVY
jgi:hypothetical protein